LSWGDQYITNPLEEVANLELIAYNKISQAIVKKKKQNIDLDNTILCTTEEHVIYTKMGKIIDLLYNRLDILHATIYKTRSLEEDIQNLEKNISLLEN